MTQPNIAGSGDGTRPTTDGGVDNIGGGERFSTQRSAAGEVVASPAPKDRMQDKRKNVDNTKRDDSAAFGLHEDLAPQPNPGPGQR